jgi:ABC-2 type transport system ATP-binding protein
MTNAVETERLTYAAGRGEKAFRLTNLSMHVPRGAVYGFLGANGSGKTTTFRLLLGLLKADSGRVAVLGEPMPDRYVQVLARTGYVPERPHIYPSLTVREAIALHRAFYASWDQKWADDLLKEFNLVPDRRQSALSKGESGKLQMLIALSQRPELLVLDEPTDGLDPVVRRDLLAALLAYVNDTQATVLISSHLVHELERICDWVGLMDHGRLLAELPMQEFKNGIKRLRIAGAPEEILDAPFTLLSRDRGANGAEQWIVRGWNESMHEFIGARGATLREVVDLDLEDGFVEILRASRTNR